MEQDGIGGFPYHSGLCELRSGVRLVGLEHCACDFIIGPLSPTLVSAWSRLLKNMYVALYKTSAKYIYCNTTWKLVTRSLSQEMSPLDCKGCCFYSLTFLKSPARTISHYSLCEWSQCCLRTYNFGLVANARDPALPVT